MKKEKEPIEKPTRFLKEEAEQIEKLRRISSPNGDEMNLIFNLYNKYVGTVAQYSTTCNCHTHIGNLYWQLLEWFGSNSSKFIN